MTIDPKLKEDLKNRLIKEKADIEKELSRFAKATEVPGEYETRYENIGNSPDENASEVEEYADNLALENTLEKELKKVTEALTRMEKGTYGFCQNCNQAIDIERLKVYPAAQNCLRCKQKNISQQN